MENLLAKLFTTRHLANKRSEDERDREKDEKGIPVGVYVIAKAFPDWT